MILAGLMLSLAAQSASATPPKPIDADGWMRGVPYPADAKAARKEGQVGFTLDVDKTGHVDSCTVTASSGSKSLDDATCTALRTRARFDPAKNAAGHDVAGHFSSVSTWRLGLSDGKPIELGKGPVSVPVFSVQVALDANGKVTGCTVLKKARLDATPCKGFPTGRQLTAPLQRNGKPTAAVYTLSDTITIRAQ